MVTKTPDLECYWHNLEASDRASMLSAISLKIARVKHSDYWTSYFLPVMIWDILKYVDDNLFWNRTDYGSSRDMEKLKECVMAIFYHFVGHQDEPLDKQSTECIAYVFSKL